MYSPRSLRAFADHPSETAQVTDTERLTWPSAARPSRRAPLRQASIGGSVSGHGGLSGWLGRGQRPDDAGTMSSGLLGGPTAWTGSDDNEKDSDDGQQ
jgi:hypothetical protein